MLDSAAFTNSENEINDGSSPRLLVQVRKVIRSKHYSIRTEHSYIEWIKRFIYFYNKRHSKDLNETHISAFLTHVAVDKRVASSTQNQALCSPVFLYRHVLKLEIGDFEGGQGVQSPGDALFRSEGASS